MRASCTTCIAVHTEFHGNHKNGLVTDTGSQKQGGIDRGTEGRGFHLSHYLLSRKERLKAAYFSDYS
jgi:hypothetical protein